MPYYCPLLLRCIIAHFPITFHYFFHYAYYCLFLHYTVLLPIFPLRHIAHFYHIFITYCPFSHSHIIADFSIMPYYCPFHHVALLLTFLSHFIIIYLPSHISNFCAYVQSYAIDGERETHRRQRHLDSGMNQVLKQYADMKKMMKQYGALAAPRCAASAASPASRAATTSRSDARLHLISHDLRAKIGNGLLMLSSVTAMLFDEQRRLLIVRDANTGKWITLGGAVDPDESPSDAIVRECWGRARHRYRADAADGSLWQPSFRVNYTNGDTVSYVVCMFEVRKISGDPKPDNLEISEVKYVYPRRNGETQYVRSHSRDVRSTPSSRTGSLLLPGHLAAALENSTVRLKAAQIPIGEVQPLRYTRLIRFEEDVSSVDHSFGPHRSENTVLPRDGHLKRRVRATVAWSNCGYLRPGEDACGGGLNHDRVDYWIGKGAQPSDTVRSFLRNRKSA